MNYIEEVPTMQYYNNDIMRYMTLKSHRNVMDAITIPPFQHSSVEMF
jgi:hypothetical protein